MQPRERPCLVKASPGASCSRRSLRIPASTRPLCSVRKPNKLTGSPRGLCQNPSLLVTGTLVLGGGVDAADVFPQEEF